MRRIPSRSLELGSAEVSRKTWPAAPRQRGRARRARRRTAHHEDQRRGHRQAGWWSAARTTASRSSSERPGPGQLRAMSPTVRRAARRGWRSPPAAPRSPSPPSPGPRRAGVDGEHRGRRPAGSAAPPTATPPITPSARRSDRHDPAGPAARHGPDDDQLHALHHRALAAAPGPGSAAGPAGARAHRRCAHPHPAGDAPRGRSHLDGGHAALRPGQHRLQEAEPRRGAALAHARADQPGLVAARSPRSGAPGDRPAPLRQARRLRAERTQDGVHDRLHALHPFWSSTWWCPRC